MSEQPADDLKEAVEILKAFRGANDFCEWHPKFHDAIARARALLKRVGEPPARGGGE